MSAACEMTDVAFSLSGKDVPEDYADLLWQALRLALPWLEDDEAAGVHPLARISQGAGLHYLSSHSRLTLRLDENRVEQARALCGTRLDLGNPVGVGAARLRPLSAAKVIYSPFVALDVADEGKFIAECERQLAALGIQPQVIVGRRQALRAEGRTVEGFSVLLHGLSAENSLRLQRTGLGVQRKRGCGIFVQHKSIAPVGGE